MYNKDRKWETTNVVLPNSLWKLTNELVKVQMWVFFFYLLKIITSIIKANTQIVSAIKPNNNKWIIFNKAVSIICTTSSLSKNRGLKAKPHLIILISYDLYYTKYLYKKQANNYKFLFFHYIMLCNENCSKWEKQVFVNKHLLL